MLPALANQATLYERILSLEKALHQSQERVRELERQLQISESFII
jgi:hypothetical protein